MRPCTKTGGPSFPPLFFLGFYRPLHWRQELDRPEQHCRRAPSPLFFLNPHGHSEYRGTYGRGRFPSFFLFFFPFSSLAGAGERRSCTYSPSVPLYSPTPPLFPPFFFFLRVLDWPGRQSLPGRKIRRRSAAGAAVSFLPLFPPFFFFRVHGRELTTSVTRRDFEHALTWREREGRSGSLSLPSFFFLGPAPRGGLQEDKKVRGTQTGWAPSRLSLSSQHQPKNQKKEKTTPLSPGSWIPGVPARLMVDSSLLFLFFPAAWFTARGGGLREPA